ncbi:hypothetical protein AYY17_05365 [Morganella psychrotolerans]|uniref:Uncharacterized protein n=1 Tax=Morganella psychrotolerans TaxID=368603 RepID=A0A1B8HEC3_9GAMM|nr:hypothetical protein AYY17_05365 [Morganella psychrotolerans]
MCFRGDVVHCLGFSCTTVTQTLLAQMLISAQYHRAQPVPLGTVPALMAALTLLMVLPPCIDVLITVTTAIRCCLCAATFAAGAGDAWWHKVSPIKKPTR